MSRKDFELIARTIRELLPDQVAHGSNESVFNADHRSYVAWRFAEALCGTNDRFNAERFLKACGVGQ